VKYADDFVLLPKKQMVLQGISNRVTETGRCCCRMEGNMEKNSGNENLKATFSIRDCDRLETREYVIFQLFE
jgi:hypothetical protein